MNQIVLHDVVVSYFDDVERHKTYHNTPRINKTKQAAFTMKWIAKLRPIHFHVPVERGNQTLLYVNEIYALRCALSFMKVSPDTLPSELYAEVLYALHYRNVDERMLIVWLSTVQAALDGILPSGGRGSS